MNQSKLTPEQIQDNIHAVSAYLHGRVVQAKSRVCEDRWDAMPTRMCFDFVTLLYRPAPTPVTRGWSKPEDVPGPVCWIRSEKDPDQMAMVVGMFGAGVILTEFEGNLRPGFFSWQELNEEPKAQYSTDCREWQPCTVTEPQP